MSENYEEQNDMQVFDNGDFYDSDLVKDSRYKTPEEALKVLFGYTSFRPGQKKVIDSILSGKDALVVMPTGGGKSLCYQIPAMLLPGITLVVSPLISLMQDQVKALNENGIPAAFINSSLSGKAFYETVNKAKHGFYKIIYVAPERLITDGFLKFSQFVQISMIAVDEAHCISQWGQDFRPSYMKIVEYVRILSKRPIISAFTATATKNVREDIECTLGLVNPYTLITGFDRVNLFFQVDKPKSKDQYILDYIANHSEDSGIIYCATRKNVDNLYELLKSKGVTVAKYHAGIGAAERKQMQDDFVFDYTSIIVATNAFGMGIDKSNVRFVIHYNMPQSMENYYQEAGRAGRDGLDSKCILLFSPQDMVINKFLLEHKEMSHLDSADKEIIKECNMRRLQIMERYCYTTECLRNYILKYFGEILEKPCENCGNCLREFETLDMTFEAKKLINCVYEAKGRYGSNIIIDTVSGAKTSRLKEIGATGYKSYGILAAVNKNLLKRLIEQLIIEEYLIVGDFRVLKVGNISALRNPDAKVFVKITDEDKLLNRVSKTKKQAKEMESLSSLGFKLFDKLKELRIKIAREEGLPPYIVFNDKTLIDMAVKIPMDKQEMLNVYGVGENKYDKYGKKFISAVEEFIELHPELLENKVLGIEEITNVNDAKKTKNKRDKQEFFLLKEEATNFRYVGLMYITEIRDEMNRICTRENVKNVYGKTLTEILVSEGLIIEKEQEGRLEKVPTSKGEEQGIKTIDKVSKKGNRYNPLIYPVSIQRMLVEFFIKEENAADKKEIEGIGLSSESSWLEERREKHTNAYMIWTEEEDKRLIDEFKSGRYSVKNLSEMHGRTMGAIRARLEKLKLIEA